ncbi:uncharacterized protein LOC142981741 [Anticarsia gemmatalis]|uniref:uncharacterized protein LOC142981741 n=1 Tax=Anticarsia gemmatalis TaxID=129554 RepID=UPI003F75C343
MNLFATVLLSVIGTLMASQYPGVKQTCTQRQGDYGTTMHTCRNIGYKLEDDGKTVTYVNTTNTYVTGPIRPINAHTPGKVSVKDGINFSGPPPLSSNLPFPGGHDSQGNQAPDGQRGRDENHTPYPDEHGGSQDHQRGDGAWQGNQSPRPNGQGQWGGNQAPHPNGQGGWQGNQTPRPNGQGQWEGNQAPRPNGQGGWQGNQMPRPDGQRGREGNQAPRPNGQGGWQHPNEQGGREGNQAPRPNGQGQWEGNQAPRPHEQGGRQRPNGQGGLGGNQAVDRLPENSPLYPDQPTVEETVINKLQAVEVKLNSTAEEIKRRMAQVSRSASDSFNPPNNGHTSPQHRPASSSSVTFNNPPVNIYISHNSEQSYNTPGQRDSNGFTVVPNRKSQANWNKQRNQVNSMPNTFNYRNNNEGRNQQNGPSQPSSSFEGYQDQYQQNAGNQRDRQERYVHQARTNNVKTGRHPPPHTKPAGQVYVDGGILVNNDGVHLIPASASSQPPEVPYLDPNSI